MYFVQKFDNISGMSQPLMDVCMDVTEQGGANQSPEKSGSSCRRWLPLLGSEWPVPLPPVWRIGAKLLHVVQQSKAGAVSSQARGQGFHKIVGLL